VTTSDGPTEPIGAAGVPPASPFTIVTIDPAQGAANARADGAVSVTFSIPAAERSLTPANFQIYRQGTDVPIPAGVAYDGETMTATLRPEAPLEEGAAYTAALRGGPGGVTSLDGQPLQGDASWNFRTGKRRPVGLIVGIVVGLLVIAGVLVWAFTRGGGSDSPSISPTSIDFGDQALGARSGARDAQVTNPSKDAVVVSSVTFTGTDAGDFVRGTATTCVAGASLGKGESCTVGVSFAPTKTGSRSASLDVRLNDGSDLTVALSGTGTGAGTAVASTSQLSFGTVTLGAPAVTRQANVSNTGNAPLQVQKVSVEGSNAADFRVASGTTCVAGTPIPAGGRCVVSVSFAPAQAGQRSANLVIAHGAPGSPLQIGLVGEGAGAAQASLTPAQADFGTGAVGTTGPPTTFTLANGGTADLPIQTIALQGSAPRAFVITTGGGCQSGGSVAAGASCTITVAFAPLNAGPVSAQLAVAAGGKTSTAALTGNGTSPTP
jgi:hypothetical protein